VSGRHLHGSFIDGDIVGERLPELGVEGVPFVLPALSVAIFNVIARLLVKNF
jgi:hypothetical protein